MFSPSFLKRSDIRLQVYTALLVFGLTLFCFVPFVGSVWYVQDDYSNFLFHQSPSVFSSIEGIVHYLDERQGRFQPFRLAIVTGFTHFFPEEAALWYNGALHLVNLFLLGVFLRYLRLQWGVVISSLLLFSLFPKWRMIESPNAMVGGSGLNLFLLLIVFHSLILSMRGEKSRRTLFYIVSILAYGCLVFSYEVAFPLLMPVFFLYLFLLQERDNKGFSYLSLLTNPCRLVPLLPYLFLLLAYFLFCYKPPDYAGSEIAIGNETLLRFKSYLLYSLPFPALRDLKLTVWSLWGVAGYLLMAGGVGYMLKEQFFRSGIILNGRKGGVFLFALSFYVASWVLFPLNHWGTPDMVMVHHTYLISAASAVFLSVSIFFCAEMLPQWGRRTVLGLGLFLLLPLCIVGSLNFHKTYAEDSQYGKARTERIKALRDGLQKRLQHPEYFDAVIIKNFHFNYDIISYVSGAVYRWVDFKKELETGRDIISFAGGEVTFRSPLSYDPHVDSSRVSRVKNNRCLILFRDSRTGQLRDYLPDVSLRRGEISYQSYGVKSESSLPSESGFDILLGRRAEWRKLSGVEVFFRKGTEFKEESDTLNITVNDEAPVSLIWRGDTLMMELPAHVRHARTVAVHIGSLFKQEVTPNIERIRLTGE